MSEILTQLQDEAAAQGRALPKISHEVVRFADVVEKEARRSRKRKVVPETFAAVGLMQLEGDVIKETSLSSAIPELLKQSQGDAGASFLMQEVGAVARQGRLFTEEPPRGMKTGLEIDPRVMNGFRRVISQPGIETITAPDVLIGMLPEIPVARNPKVLPFVNRLTQVATAIPRLAA